MDEIKFTLPHRDGASPTLDEMCKCIVLLKHRLISQFQFMPGTIVVRMGFNVRRTFEAWIQDEIQTAFMFTRVTVPPPEKRDRYGDGYIGMMHGADLVQDYVIGDNDIRMTVEFNSNQFWTFC